MVSSPFPLLPGPSITYEPYVELGIRPMVDLYCASFRQVPNKIVLDADNTFDAVHGGQQMRLFNAHYDEYGFQPIVVFDGEGRFVTAVLRPAKRPSGREVRAFLRRPLRQLRANWPRVEVLLRADSHYCGPEVLRWCRANKVGYLLGVARDRRKIGGQAAIAIGGHGSLAGWNFCPKPEPSVPL